MNDFYTHETASVDEGAQIGEGTKVWHYTHIYSNVSIGSNCVIAQNVMIGPGVLVGNNVKIQNNVSLYSGITLEDGVFCGPSAVFTNIRIPRAFVEKKDQFEKTTVRQGASLGANCTIICGIEIGRYAMIGAGAVVTKNIRDHELVVGNPAKHIGWVSRVGEKLNSNLECPVSKEKYELTQSGLKLVT